VTNVSYAFRVGPAGTEKEEQDMISISDEDPTSGGNERRANANRKNAQKSTGPRTTEGKARSSRNATKYGVWARLPIAIARGNFIESEEVVEKIINGIVESLAPLDLVQAAQAHEIATLYLRIGRVATMESEALCGRGTCSEYPSVQAAVGWARLVDAESVFEWVLGVEGAELDFRKIYFTLMREFNPAPEVVGECMSSQFDFESEQFDAEVYADVDRWPAEVYEGLAKHLLHATHPDPADALSWAVKFAARAETQLENAAAHRAHQAQLALREDLNTSSQISDRLHRQLERALTTYRKMRGEEGP
jgi:hypothetical protein